MESQTMLLPALARYYSSRAEIGIIPPLGYSRVTLQGVVNIAADGAVVSITQDRNWEIVAKPPSRTKAIVAGLLVETAEYLFGIGDKRAAEKRAAARQLHNAVLGTIDTPAARAACKFFEVDHSRYFADNPDIADNFELGYYALAHDGQIICQLPEIKDAVTQSYRDNQKISDFIGFCTVLGKPAHLLLNHPQIKRLPGADPWGVRLITQTQTGQRRESTLNAREAAPISVEGGLAVAAALQHLVDSEQCAMISGFAVLVWSEEPHPAESQLAELIISNDYTRSTAFAAFDDDEIYAGQPDSKFWILVLKANRGTIQIVWQHHASLQQIINNWRLFIKAVSPSVTPPHPVYKFPTIADYCLCLGTYDAQNDRYKANSGAMQMALVAFLSAIFAGRPLNPATESALISQMRVDSRVDDWRAGLLQVCSQQRAEINEPRQMRCEAI